MDAEKPYDRWPAIWIEVNEGYKRFWYKRRIKPPAVDRFIIDSDASVTSSLMLNGSYNLLKIKAGDIFKA